MKIFNTKKLILKCLGIAVVVNGVTEEVKAVQAEDTRVLFTWKFSDSYI